MAVTLGELKPIGEGKSTILTKERLIVGRDRLCDVVIHVAPVQCQLLVRNSFWYVRNLSDGYPTKVNAVDVVEQHLDSGDILWLSPKHKYAVVYDPNGLATEIE